MPIGEVLTQSDLKSLAAWSAADITHTVYVAPTVYHLKTDNSPRWNYYTSLKDALNQWKYLNKMPGAKAVAAPKASAFTKGVNQTFGINVDFFFFHPVFGLVPANYSFAKKYMYQNPVHTTCVIRFYKTEGSGPFYAIIDRRAFGISATTYKDIATSKVNALQDFNNSVQLLKARYNTLAKFVSDLSKKQKNAIEQQVFDESLLTLLNFERQLKILKGVDIVWSSTGAISGPDAVGLVPLVWIAIIVVSAITVSYSIDKITSYLKDAKAVEQSNNTVKFVEEQRLKIAAAIRAGKITNSDASYLNEKLDNTAAAAAQNITDVTMKKDGDVFDKITNLILIGGGIFLLSKVIK